MELGEGGFDAGQPARCLLVALLGLDHFVIIGRWAMPDAAAYDAIERLRDGRRLEIRSLRPADRADLVAAVDRVGTQSLYRRFMGIRREFSDKEIDSYVNVDFISHVALVGVIEERGQPTIVGAGRYVVVGPGAAELAFAVVDQYQGQGIGSTLMRHLIAIARQSGLKELVADVLADNAAMLKIFQRSGLSMTTRREASAVHIQLLLS
jgi:ribosomal protein S18 acetylase RimI-like enzyme